MSATDGSTPLNAANVPHKLSDETITGNYTFQNKATLFSGGNLRIPFRHLVQKAFPQYHDTVQLLIPFPLIAVNDPGAPVATSAVSLPSGNVQSIIALTPTFDSPNAKRRSVIVEISPLQIFTNTTAAGNSSQNFIDVASTAGFPSLGYVAIDGGEIVNYTGITPTQFQNVQRGLFITTAKAFNPGASIDLVYSQVVASGYVTIPIP